MNSKTVSIQLSSFPFPSTISSLSVTIQKPNSIELQTYSSKPSSDQNLNCINSKQDSKDYCENPKNVFLEKFKLQKNSLQSSSIYNGVDQIKKKKYFTILDNSYNLPSFKNSSNQKLPSLKNDKTNKNNSITPSYSIKSNCISSKQINSEPVKQAQNYQTITNESPQTLGKVKKHLAKRKSLYESEKLTDADGETKDLRNTTSQISPKNNLLNFCFNEQTKKKYIKSIVDRYFCIEQKQAFKQSQNQKSEDSKRHLNRQKALRKSFFVSAKLPILNKNNSEFKNNSKNNSEFKANQEFKINSEFKNKLQSTNVLSQLQNSLEDKYLSTLQIDSSQQASQLENNLLANSNSSTFSLSKSYILDKIEENQEFQDQRVEDFYNSDRELSKKKSLQKSTESILNSSSQQFIQLIKNQKQKKFQKYCSKIYQNHSFCIYKVKTEYCLEIYQRKNTKNPSVSHEFRKYFTSQSSLQLKKRQIKAKEIIQNTCKNFIGSLWQEDKFDKTCIKLNFTKNSSCFPGYEIPSTVSKLLYKIYPQIQNGENKLLIIKPTQPDSLPKPLISQSSLLIDSHFGLIHLLLSLCTPFCDLSQTIINNKLSINNILYVDQKLYTINQWSYSYFRQQFLIQKTKFQKRLEPLLKNQFGQWFITPEYLAPEVLQNICFSKQKIAKYLIKLQGKKMEISIVREHDLFKFGNKSDVWSLGLLILQLITLIPIWIGDKCIVQNKKNPKITPRRGFLHAEKRDLLKILTKQSYLVQNLSKILRIESEPYQIEDWLSNLLIRMVCLDPQKRISFQEIVQVLKEQEKKASRLAQG